VPGLHGGHDGLQGSRVVGVASKHLIAQRETVESNDESYQYLLAIRTVIARVAALRQWICYRLAFKVGARHVVEQHFVLDRK